MLADLRLLLWLLLQMLVVLLWRLVELLGQSLAELLLMGQSLAIWLLWLMWPQFVFRLLAEVRLLLSLLLLTQSKSSCI